MKLAIQGKRPVFSVALKDCRVETFRSGGKGGQNQNKVESGVRVTHEPSGAIGEARDSRDQLHNKRQAFLRMAASRPFQTWARVEALSQPEDFLIEYATADGIFRPLKESHS
jgi:protein subunit release factor B